MIHPTDTVQVTFGAEKETPIMDIYARLEVRKIINACGFATDLGGSLVAPEVLEAMAQASPVECRHEGIARKGGKAG